MATPLKIVIAALILYSIYWVCKKALLWLLSLCRRGVSSMKNTYQDNEEEINEMYRKSKESAIKRGGDLKDALKDALPDQETVTTGRKTATKAIRLVVIGMVLGVFLFGLIAISVLSNFNFAAGLY